METCSKQVLSRFATCWIRWNLALSQELLFYIHSCLSNFSFPVSCVAVFASLYTTSTTWRHSSLPPRPRRTTVAVKMMHCQLFTDLHYCIFLRIMLFTRCSLIVSFFSITTGSGRNITFISRRPLMLMLAAKSKELQQRRSTKVDCKRLQQRMQLKSVIFAVLTRHLFFCVVSFTVICNTAVCLLLCQYGLVIIIIK